MTINKYGEIVRTPGAPKKVHTESTEHQWNIADDLIRMEHTLNESRPAPAESPWEKFCDRAAIPVCFFVVISLLLFFLAGHFSWPPAVNRLILLANGVAYGLSALVSWFDEEGCPIICTVGAVLFLTVGLMM